MTWEIYLFILKFQYSPTITIKATERPQEIKVCFCIAVFRLMKERQHLHTDSGINITLWNRVHLLCPCRLLFVRSLLLCPSHALRKVLTFGSGWHATGTARVCVCGGGGMAGAGLMWTSTHTLSPIDRRACARVHATHTRSGFYF